MAQAAQLPHPAIGSKRRKLRSVNRAPVTCPLCQSRRWLSVSELSRALKRGTFTGRCRMCQQAPVPMSQHPAISHEYEMRPSYAGQTLCAKVTCPTCNKERWYPLWSLRQFLKRENFSGHCRPCGIAALRAGHLRYVKSKGFGQHVTSNGYVNLTVAGINHADLPLFRAMSTPAAARVLEHRWAMAKHLSRPLLSSECIDHMDGDKSNNAISNLRIYVKGKNQPGSGPGHGTYYHEWQMALARIKQLESH